MFFPLFFGDSGRTKQERRAQRHPPAALFVFFFPLFLWRRDTPRVAPTLAAQPISVVCGVMFRSVAQRATAHFLFLSEAERETETKKKGNKKAPTARRRIRMALRKRRAHHQARVGAT
nr:hypothetical protein [Pandoravirus belohorizontensis]